MLFVSVWMLDISERKPYARLQTFSVIRIFGKMFGIKKFAMFII